MMNKRLEVIEASYLFALCPDEIDVLVHPQSIITAWLNFRIVPSLPNWVHPTCARRSRTAWVAG